jgi:hypothetical protein
LTQHGRSVARRFATRRIPCGRTCLEASVRSYDIEASIRSYNINRGTLRKLTAGPFVTLDGVVESPERWPAWQVDVGVQELLARATAQFDAIRRQERAGVQCN